MCRAIPTASCSTRSSERVYDLSHAAPHVTVIDAKDGSIVGTIDLGGTPEQAVTDGKGHLYIDLEDKDNIAVVDAKTMTYCHDYDLAGKGGTCAGSGLRRQESHSLCRLPQSANMVILNADDGKIITTLADRRGHRWRRVQPQHHGSIQLAGRRHADRR